MIFAQILFFAICLQMEFGNALSGETMSFLDSKDPLLSSIAEEVPQNEITLPKTQGIIEQMLEIAKGERSDISKRNMVGLAAPQIGIQKRIILVDISVTTERKQLGELQIFINPEIIARSDDLLLDREACYSVDRHICGIVPRHASIKLIAYDRHGNPICGEFHEYTARIFQHEIDHLNGIRFPDRVGENGILHWVEADEFMEYRENWRNWSKRCPWHHWISR